MTERPDVTLDELLTTARAIVNHKSSRGPIGLPVTHITAMAHTLCGLDDMVRLSAEYFAVRNRMLQAGTQGDAAREAANDDALRDIELELIEGLVALGYLTLITKKDA